MIDDITPIVITHNEEANIARTLDRLTWAKRIVVIDSGSTDETLKIVRSYRQVEVVHKQFEDFASQCNFGMTQVSTPWVLSLDADYELSDELVAELHDLHPDSTAGGYQARFVYRIFGRPLRGTLYPPRTVLHRKGGAFYQNEGHAHRVIVAGKVMSLSGVIFHDDRKSLASWFSSQQRYACGEAEHLLASKGERLGAADRIRLLGWPAPFAVFLYTLVVKGCLLDGWPGWYYALQRLLFEIMLALHLIEQRFRQRVQA